MARLMDLPHPSPSMVEPNAEEADGVWKPIHDLIEVHEGIAGGLKLGPLPSALLAPYVDVVPDPSRMSVNYGDHLMLAPRFITS